MVVRTVAGRQFELTPAAVEAAVHDVLPDPLRRHYVVVAGRRYPPKQVLELATGVDRADFTTHQARRILQRLGFAVGRVSAPAPLAEPGFIGPHGGREAEALRPYRGRWVAQRGLDVLVAADDPLHVVAWLNRHGERGATVFRVPVHRGETEVPPS